MPVYLRKREYKTKFRYYLDIYHNGNRRYEYLDLYHEKSKNPIISKNNKYHKELAEQIRATKQLEIEGDNYNIDAKHRQDIYFVDYFTNWIANYPNKDVRLAKACLTYFIKFLKATDSNQRLTTKDIDKHLAKNFREFLTNNLNGETPHNYFQKFIKLCHEATEKKIFKENPCKGIRNTRPEGLKKDILSKEEIIILHNTPAGNNEIKRAFMFCLNTGIRWIDVKHLKWRNVEKNYIKVPQLKTGIEVIINLNDRAKEILSERGKRDELVFNLPSHSYALRFLQKWVDSAGIDKKITWHCSRHSFAVNLLINQTDIKTTSSLLGHTTMKHTEKYTRVVNELKKKAVDNINY